MSAFDKKDSEIDVEDLMAKIREEAAKRGTDEAPAIPLPNHANTHHITSPSTFSINWPQFTAILSQIERNVNAGTENLPMEKFARPYRWIARLAGWMVLYMGEVITNPQRKFNHSVLDALRVSVDVIRRLEQGLGERGSRIAALEQSLKERDNRISGLEASLDQGLSDRDNRIDGLDKSVKQELMEQYGRIAALEQSLKERDNRISGLEASLNQGLSDRDNRIDGLEKNIANLKNSLILQERRVAMLLEEARKRLPEPFNQKQLQVIANESAHLLDSLYVSMLDQFRGTREEIKDRLRVHLPLLENTKAGKEKRPILDLGCGRGEWLELLQEKGLLARGVDISSILVEQCREKGLEVIESEMVTFLQKIPEASLGGVTGFHIIEHLPFELLIKLLDETVRVLKPGGIAIFETPNPHNILVGSCNFYLDPAHKKPLPSSMMKFIAEARGLCRVEIMNLHPFPESCRLSGSDLAERMNEYFYGPQDYALIGWKA